MRKTNGQSHYSPSDLVHFMESPFVSWMDRFAIEHPEQAPKRDPKDPLMKVLAKKGYSHEGILKDKFKQCGLKIVEISKGSSSEQRIKTQDAMDRGEDIIVQGRLELAEFGGYSDFLVKIPGKSALGDYHYEIWDAKLASSARPAFLIQLCCYAEMLEAMQGRRPDCVVVELGNGTRQRFKTLDYYSYYQALKTEFLQAQQDFAPKNQPDPAQSASWGDWSDHAEQMLLERDHLLQVATITRGQIKKLNCAGITTMDGLVASTLKRVGGINSDVLARLKSQAAVQNRTKQQQASDASLPPCFEIRTPAKGEQAGLALLPPHSPLDVFFDIEGYPFDEGGLEYLWGVTYFTSKGERTFKDLWAHNPEQEQEAFQAFIEWVYKRWQQDPTMHIYHYANYEIAACRKLMGRYGVCEYEVDQLLRNEVFVDVYKVVRGGMVLGEPRYSIKNVEHLYRDKRETEVGSGDDSVEVYDRWREYHQDGEQGDTWETSELLKGIRDYNIDDCDSTQELVDWLRKQQEKHKITYLGKTEVVEPEVKEEITARIWLRESLLKRAHSKRKSAPEQAELDEHMAWTLEFHRREDKPVFWRLFDRLGLSNEELLDDIECLACCERTKREPFKLTPRTRNLAYEYRFDANQEFKVSAKSFYLLGVETEDGFRTRVTYVPQESDLDNGIIVVQSKEAPPETITLVPDQYVNPKPIPDAIADIVAEYKRGELHKHKAILNFLTRSKPRFKEGFSLPSANGEIAPNPDPKKRLAQIIEAACHLDASCLTIQGPPGAGKSYTGKHVIAKLVQSGARIGIASNSHKAINNLVLSTAQYCRNESIDARFAYTGREDSALEQCGATVVASNKLIDCIRPGCVLGATAWGFSREDMVRQLDYLFVDEAGQVSVANLIAMSRSAKNLILMGDQMQLGQPSQGTHPADSGLSVLDYLLRKTPTIPQDRGVFLGTTYRMHSRVNRFISTHIYEGKLQPDTNNDQRIIDVPADYRSSHPNGLLDKEAGILFVPVEHEGNTQASDEEVEKIQELANALLGRAFRTANRETRPITWDDMLFVAPYNHQVNKLKQALGGHARVGSVDKFQGQEAPIVFLSMCASNPAESPRGLDFLFDRRRMNVAISRAQTLSIVVANPAIGRVPVSRVEQLKLANLFNALSLNDDEAIQNVAAGQHSKKLPRTLWQRFKKLLRIG